MISFPAPSRAKTLESQGNYWSLKNSVEEQILKGNTDVKL